MSSPGSTGSTAKTMNSTPTLTCAQCGEENALTSRFCQHCGAPLAAAQATAAPVAGASATGAPATGTAVDDGTAPTATAPTAAPQSATTLGGALPPTGAPHPTGALPPIGAVLPPAASPAPNMAAAAAPPVASSTAPASDASVAPGQTANDIDQRRAHQLLDRALMLSERGDIPGAILACRQAVSLAPASAQGYSMWGLLLERAGETNKAIAAYEKVLELAPDSMLERESLQRLRASAARNSLTGTFHFDEGELFDDALGPANPETSPPAPALAAHAPGIAPDTGTTPDGSTQATVPVAPVTPAPAVPTPTALRFDDPMDTPTGGPLWWQALLRQPSYYFRGAPIMATTVIGLLFLLWARNWAATHYVPTLPPTGAEVTEVVPGDVNAPGGVVNMNPTPALRVIPEGPAAVTNNPNAAAPAGAPNTATANGGSSAGGDTTAGGATTAGGGTARSTSRTTSGSATSSLPRVSPPVLPPANPRTAGSRPASGAAPSGGVPSMPAPRVDLNSRSTTPEAPPVVVSPGTNDSGSTAGGGSSAAGGPLNPSAGAGRGYIRITPETAPERAVPRSVSPASAPARSDNLADNEEWIASADARAGRSGRAVERLTAAISSGGSTGYRYQQRATVFLERADYARAADEYQTAIAAYEDQIRRGDNVAQARAGLRSSRSGLRVAMAGLQR